MTDTFPRHNTVDSGLECLILLAQFHHVATNAAQLEAPGSADSGKPFGEQELLPAGAAG